MLSSVSVPALALCSKNLSGFSVRAACVAGLSICQSVLYSNAKAIATQVNKRHKWESVSSSDSNKKVIASKAVPVVLQATVMNTTHPKNTAQAAQPTVHRHTDIRRRHAALAVI